MVSLSTSSQPLSRFWFAIVVPPAAWMLQLVISWLVNYSACGIGLEPRGSLNSARAVLLTIDVLAVVVCAAAVWVGVSQWRQSQDVGLTAVQAEDSSDFLKALALFVSLTFLAATVLQLLPTLFLPVCRSIR